MLHWMDRTLFVVEAEVIFDVGDGRLSRLVRIFFSSQHLHNMILRHRVLPIVIVVPALEPF